MNSKAGYLTCLGVSMLFRNNAAHFSQFQFGLYSPICRIRLHFHHIFRSSKDSQYSDGIFYRIKIWDYSHSESGRSKTNRLLDFVVFGKMRDVDTFYHLINPNTFKRTITIKIGAKTVIQNFVQPLKTPSLPSTVNSFS